LTEVPGRAHDISDDGRFVVFTEETPGSCGPAHHAIQLYDRWLRTRSCVTTTIDGAPPNSGSTQPSISADGRFVVYTSWATNLVPNDTNGPNGSEGGGDIFLFDRLQGTTRRVSVDAAGQQLPARSESPAISSDGSTITFAHFPGHDSNAIWMVVDRLGGRPAEIVPDQRSVTMSPPSMSRDGRTLVFQSFDHDTETSTGDGYFRLDRAFGIVQRLAIPQIELYAGTPVAISGNARYVVFGSPDSRIVAGDDNGASDVFLYDHQTKKTELISVTHDGRVPTRRSYPGSVSDDGRYVTFRSEAPDLVLGDSNNKSDVFVRDRVDGWTDLVSQTNAGTPFEIDTIVAGTSSDGRHILINGWQLVGGQSLPRSWAWTRHS
jgi:Tol biopolymer transport system component